MSEPLIPVTEVPVVIQRIRGGRRISRATAWRWATKGFRGRKLWSQWTGRRLETTEQAVRDFLERTSKRERPPKIPHQRRRGAFLQAMSVLKELGMVKEVPK